MDTTVLLQGFTTLGSDPIARNAFLAYVLACLLGQIGNAAWMWLGKEIDCVADRFREDPRATVKAMLAQAGGVVAFAAVIPFDTMPFRTAMVLGFLQGVAADSKLNRSSRAVWSKADRAIVTAVSDATNNGGAMTAKDLSQGIARLDADNQAKQGNGGG